MSAGRGVATAGGLARHVPVMLPDVLEALMPCRGGIFVDGTFGSGGYSRALLEAGNCTVIAFDRDPDAIARGAGLVRNLAPRLSLVEACFGDMAGELDARGVASVQGVTLDIGVSSGQLGDPNRGFSFQSDGPLDMRMGGDGPTAADAVNRLDEADLASVIHILGEEQRSRAVARAIVQARPLETTRELAGVVARVLGQDRTRINPATRTFQAIRIFINRELDELADGLEAAERMLAPGGRLAVVSFHSLEDRIVKRFIAERTGRDGSVSRHRPEPPTRPDPSFRIVGRAMRRPRAHEIETNARARSARLRVAERTQGAPWPLSREALGVPAFDRLLEGLQ